MNYEVNREKFNKILNSYLAYMKLFKSLNGGSIEGAAAFDEFYWRFTYYVRYQNNSTLNQDGN